MYKNKDGKLFYAITQSIDVPKQSLDNSRGASFHYFVLSDSSGQRYLGPGFP